MCGIAGLWTLTNYPAEGRPADIVRRMTRALSHRGPDDEGYFLEDGIGLALGFRRLSIVDLSPMGHQPMMSSTGRYVVVFNGEIFNHKKIRQELESAGHRFRGHSDTEVMLAAIEQWGLADALHHFIGMFAIALWDRHRRCLTLVRDRLGIKPLYLGWTRAGFVFGSELKAFEATPRFDLPIDRDALALLLRQNCIPAPHSIYRGIVKLLPGTLIEIDQRFVDGCNSPDEAVKRMSPFWSPLDVAMGARSDRIVDDVEAIERLDELLRDAVALRMEADVPLGAFLSGGIDSSSVVALMQAQSSRPVRTFSIGFHEEGYDEAPFAKRVAGHLGTDHTEFYVTPRDALDVIPQLPSIYDEPFSDSSQIPTYLVSKLARRHVTVCLSGDGGDELFGGYDRYFWARRVWKGIGLVPPAAKHAIARILRSAPGVWDRTLEGAMPVLPRRLRVKDPSSKAETVATVLSCDSFDDLYLHMLSHWKNTADLARQSHALGPLLDPGTARQFPDILERMMFTDLVNYLPDDILTKVDRASMAVSLEARVPILDHRVVEFAWRLPVGLKVRDGRGKWILRQVLNKYVPEEITNRPKMGFGVPIAAWLRGPLREWADDLLDERRLKDEGYFEPGPIRQMFEGHLTERFNAHFYLWDVLMFQAWLAERKTSAGSPRSSAATRGVEVSGEVQLLH